MGIGNQDVLLKGLFQQNRRKGMFSIALIILLLLMATPYSRAMVLYDSDDMRVDFKNTLKYSISTRTESANRGTLSQINSDDGDRNFTRDSLISNRFDIFSELNLTYKNNYGFRVTGAAWEDLVYTHKNQNNSPATNNWTGRNKEFPDDTENLAGEDAEFLDTFFFARGSLSDHTWYFRGGKHNVSWGETLFYAPNGITAGMSPMDLAKGAGVPDTLAKELFRPVNQVSGSINLINNLALAGYYQFDFEQHQLPAAGSFFNRSDFMDEGGVRFLLAPAMGGRPAAALWRAKDMPADNTHMYGVSLKYNAASATYGLYYTNYNERAPQLYTYAGINANPLVGKLGDYRLVYPEDIDLYGASFSTLVYGASVGLDVNYRHNMDLTSNPQSATGKNADNNDNPLYAIGDSLHANLNAQYMFPTVALYDTKLWGSLMLMGEVEMAQYLCTDKNKNAMRADTADTAWAFRIVASPTYNQVFPLWDLMIPLSFSYMPTTKVSKVYSSFGNPECGDWSIGTKWIYRSTWNLTLKYVNFFGDATINPTTDRDYLSFSVNKTF